MAQPVFDGHPLEEYFRDSGEASESMPGGIADFALQPYLAGSRSVSKHSQRMERLCFLIFGVVESFSSFFFPDHTSLRTQAFAERFKYGVISSSLLSPAFAATPIVESHRRGLSPPLPGKLHNGHSRTSSMEESAMADNLTLSMPPESETPPLWPVTLSFTVAVAAFSARLYFIAFLLLAGTLYYIHTRRLGIRFKPDVMAPSLLALQHLISAGRLWDSVINDAFAMMENEEQSIFYGPTSPLLSSSSLRVALSTSLLTTQTQCDNIRQLFSAITSPSELAQLAEMYAPPSPVKLTFVPGSGSHRPLSHPGSSPRATPLMDRTTKRATWNGSYASLAHAGTPSAFQFTQRRERRRSDLSALIGATSPTPARSRSRNARSSSPQLLAEVSEEEEGMVTAESSVAGDEEECSFGAAALGLYRNRMSGGLQAFELSSRSTPSSLTRGDLTKRRFAMSSGSRYTSMHTTRYPLSLSSLRQSLQNALGSKRFACSHLLALRFEDDEDEVYWEDVRSVMSLLTSTLVDASSRLSEVLDDVEERHLKADDTASESASGCNTPSSRAFSPPVTRSGHFSPFSQAVEQIVPFAPMPSDLARFASHVDAISSALDDAREQLAQCVASLKEERAVQSPGHSTHPSSSSCGDALPGSVAVAATSSGIGTGTFEEPLEHPAIQAYERLRRELGLALRECERGRERLVHLVAPRTQTPPTDDEEPHIRVEDPGDATGTGANCDHVTQDVPPPSSQAANDEDDMRLTVVSPSGEPVPLNADPGLRSDDASAVQGVALPGFGIEQVFEAESGNVGGFTRARSTLSREERIRRVRAQRARVDGASRDDDGDVREQLTRPGHDPLADDTTGLPVRADLDPDSASAMTTTTTTTMTMTMTTASAPARLALPPPPGPPPGSLLPPMPTPTSTPTPSTPTPTPVAAAAPVTTITGSGRRECELWGPSGEVVQELRDVIWKVGERRRKMMTEQRQQLRTVATLSDMIAQPAQRS